jgi:hypothetical protein
MERSGWFLVKVGFENLRPQRAHRTADNGVRAYAKKRARLARARSSGGIALGGNFCLAAAESGRLHGLAGNVCRGCDALHTQLEVVGVRGVLERGFVADQAGLE